MNEYDRIARYYGEPTLAEWAQSVPLYTRQIITDWRDAYRWFHGIYISEFDSVYGAEGVRVVVKRVPDSVAFMGVLIETAYPDLNPSYYPYCG